jgi:hypothetical protein
LQWENTISTKSWAKPTWQLAPNLVKTFFAKEEVCFAPTLKILA